MRVIDMHNLIVAPELVAFLEREGEHYDTRIVKREGKRFFLIQESALRPIHDKITHPEARLADMAAEGIDLQALSCVPFVMYPEVTPALGLAIAQVNNDALVVIGTRQKSWNVRISWDSVGLRFRRILEAKGSTRRGLPSFGKRRRRCRWWCVFIPSRQSRREHWLGMHSGISLVISMTLDLSLRC